MKAMKNIIHFLIIILAGISIYSCRQKAVPEPEPGIVKLSDSAQLKPEVKMTYTLLDSGGVKFLNETKNIKDIEWRIEGNIDPQFSDKYSRVYTSRAVSPEFYFETNGVKNIHVQIRGRNDRDTSITFKVDIKNSLNLPPFKAHLKGVLFDKPVDAAVHGSNNFFGVGITVMPVGTPLNNILYQNSLIMVISDFFENQGKDYESMKKNLQPGVQRLIKANAQKENGWLVSFPNKSNRINLGMTAADTLEISEVREISQLKRIPEMEDKAFIVTFRMKGHIEGFGKIDCVLNTRYLLYHEYLKPVF